MITAEQARNRYQEPPVCLPKTWEERLAEAKQQIECRIMDLSEHGFHYVDQFSTDLHDALRNWLAAFGFLVETLPERGLMYLRISWP